MNIAFLNSIAKDTYGGMEEWIRLVSAGLEALGHRVTLIGRPGSKYLRRISKGHPDTDIVELDISGDFNPFTISRLRKFLRDKKIEILLVNFNKDVRLGGIAARLNGDVKVVWSVGINIAENGFVHRILTPRLVDKIIVPSESLKREIASCKHIDVGSIEVIPIGIGDNSSVQPRDKARRRLRKTYGLPDDATVAVTVGRFVYQKGHEYLVDAAVEITRRFPDLYFLLLGDGPGEKKLRTHIEKLGLTDRFIFAGMVDDVDRELAGCDLMIHPSKEEPFGIALLEGMRMGLPIIASRVGGIPEVVSDEESALLFEPCSPWAIAEAASEVLADRDRMKRMGEAGRLRWREKFSYEKMIRRVSRCLTELSGALRSSTLADSGDESAAKNMLST
ncbi:MAG: glycosyltransferase family 4 protein [Candidatus Zixiibacteriota bacterium]